MISQPKKLKQLYLNTARFYHLPKGVFLHLKYIVLTGLPACSKFRFFNNNNSEKAFAGINLIKLRFKESSFSLGRQRMWFSSLIRLLSKDRKMNASAISKLFSTSPTLEILDLGENYLPRDPIVLLAMVCT
jgi:hypothetical protein